MLPTLDDFLSGRVKTLGWQILDWGSTYLGQPDGAYKGAQWQYTREQALFILRFYSVDDYGIFRYRRAVLERVKGWGKSPLLAAICCTELLGPTRFDGWDANGDPVGKPASSPLVQIAAISESQANNTMDLVGEMLAEGQAINAYPGLDIALSRVRAPGNRRIEKVTASFRSREGNRATFVVMDETHLWVPAEKGPELADVLRRNLAKSNSRSIETTNAHAPGENSVAEESYKAFLAMQSGGTYDQGLLFDTREVFVDDIYDKEKAFPALVEAYGDAAVENGGWVDIERIYAEIMDPGAREHMSRRFYFNQKIEGHSTWLRREDWQGCFDDSIQLDTRNDLFAVGFKGAVRNGAAALVACRLNDFALFPLRVWEKPDTAPPDWEVPFAEVDAAARSFLEEEGCWKLVADPDQWQEVVGRWYGDYEDKVEEFWFSSNRAKQVKAVERFETTVLNRRLKWSDPNLSRHVQNAHTTEVPSGDPTRPGITLRKESPGSKRYIAIAQAAVIALEAAELSIEEGALNVEEHEIYGADYHVPEQKPRNPLLAGPGVWRV